MLDSSSDWKSEVPILLHYYFTRPHAAIGLSPMEAMCGWLPCQLIVDESAVGSILSVWVGSLAGRSARIQDFVEAELSSHDFVEVNDSNPYAVADAVLLRHPARSVFSKDFRLSMAGRDLKVYEFLDRIRALRSATGSRVGAVSSAATFVQDSVATPSSRLCYQCGEPGHFKRHCPKLSLAGNG